MNEDHWGEVIYVDLNPAKGGEKLKKRPCVVVSNSHYNQVFNTVVVAPISSCAKYKEERYQKSSLFIEVPENNQVRGTILLQYIRTIDPRACVNDKAKERLPLSVMREIQQVLSHFF